MDRLRRALPPRPGRLLPAAGARRRPRPRHPRPTGRCGELAAVARRHAGAFQPRRQVHRRRRLERGRRDLPPDPSRRTGRRRRRDDLPAAAGIQTATGDLSACRRQSRRTCLRPRGELSTRRSRRLGGRPHRISAGPPRTRGRSSGAGTQSGGQIRGTSRTGSAVRRSRPRRARIVASGLPTC